MFMKHIISLLVVLFFGSNLFAQGEKGNATTSNSAPEQIEINTRNSINSISNQPIINSLDTVQSTIFENQDVELKEVQTITTKNKINDRTSMVSLVKLRPWDWI